MSCGKSGTSRSIDGAIGKRQETGGGKRTAAAMNGCIQIGQTQKVSIGTDEAFELPPNFLDRVEFMAAVGRQINQIDARLRGQPFEESLA